MLKCEIGPLRVIATRERRSSRCDGNHKGRFGKGCRKTEGHRPRDKARRKVHLRPAGHLPAPSVVLGSGKGVRQSVCNRSINGSASPEHLPVHREAGRLACEGGIEEPIIIRVGWTDERADESKAGSRRDRVDSNKLLQ